MSLDTKYRPLHFDDVLGQGGHTTVLRQFIIAGMGFYQSYVFCGGHGCGKTTLGRILARGLLCETPAQGNPCDKCVSCTSILRTGASECFVEFDAATNSGKDDIKKITDTLSYDTFSGKRRIYLFDEAHQLSRNALDALLKPMEDAVQGSEEKKLICIFCTTEPNKMRDTIFSRCAPKFVIRRVTPEKIAERMAFICDQESIEYDLEALVLIAEAKQSHIRPCLKAIEGVSQLGRVNKENVFSYLQLDANVAALEMLFNLGRDLPQVLTVAEEMFESVSPATLYELLAETSMLAYKTALGLGKPPMYWDAEKLTAVGEYHADHLIRFSHTFASRPGHPNLSMLLCDLSQLHHQRRGEWGAVTTIRQVVVQESSAPVSEAPTTSAPEISPEVGSVTQTPEPLAVGKTAVVTAGGVYVDQRAVNKRSPSEQVRKVKRHSMPPDEFRAVLARRVDELSWNERRRPEG